MSTRSYIGIKNNNQIVYQYCHFDGYLEGVGRELLTHYTELNKVSELINKGAIRYIDKGEVEYLDSEAPMFALNSSLDEIFTNSSVEYIYLFDMNTNEWESYDSYYDDFTSKCHHRMTYSQEDMKLYIETIDDMKS